MATLAGLPVELVERVVRLLTIEEVGSLRLVSRELRNKASQYSYLSNFINHSVDLSETSLGALISILSEDNLSRSLRHLSITALLYDIHSERVPISPFTPDWAPPLLSQIPRSFCSSENRGTTEIQERRQERQRRARIVLRRAQHEVNVETGIYPGLVRQCFQLIKLHCKDGVLESLRLHCKVDAGDGFKVEVADNDAKYNNLSAHASYLFSTTMDALLATSLSVKQLDIFSTTRHCSLPLTELSPFLGKVHQPALRMLTNPVTSLAMSFSRLTNAEAGMSRHSCCDCNARRSRRSGVDIVCHKHSCNFDDEEDLYCQSEASLASFLKLFPNLKDFNLHQYDIERSNDKHNPVAFEGVAQAVQLPQLRKLALRGINADESSLLAFLTAHRDLQSLDLRYFNLREGQWQSVLSHIKTQKPDLRSLTLEDLFENKRADHVTIPSSHPHIMNIPPPPPMFGGIPPPPLPLASTQADTYLNTLLTFRVLNIPEQDVVSSGSFRANQIKITGPGIAKADILYSFVSHATNKWKIEKKWATEQTKEYGPPPRDLLLDY